MPPTPVLKTPRLILRPLRRKDAPVIQRLFPRWEIVRYLNASIPWPYPADGAAGHIETCLGETLRNSAHDLLERNAEKDADVWSLVARLARKDRG